MASRDHGSADDSLMNDPSCSGDFMGNSVPSAVSFADDEDVSRNASLSLTNIHVPFRSKSVDELATRKRISSRTTDDSRRGNRNNQSPELDYEAVTDKDPTISEYRKEIEKGKKASLFHVGRDFKPAGAIHRFTNQERHKMSHFESLDYHQAVSKVYQHHLEKTDPGWKPFTKWMVMMMVAVVVGVIAFLQKQSIEALSDMRARWAQEIFTSSTVLSAYFKAWTFMTLFNLLLTLLAAAPVVFLVPHAGGSGVPEVMAYLNGVLLPKVFNVRTLVCKLWSVIFGVASGLPIGPEGPMIHIGAMVGAGISQGRSRTLGIDTWKFRSIFKQFRNNKDHRDFIVAGAASGVAAAFGAPIGGLVFVMEEIASWWDVNLAWMIFFACMVTTFSAEWANSLFSDFKLNAGNPFEFRLTAMVHFQQTNTIVPNVLAILPAMLIGVLGGVVGTIFTWVNLKVQRFRARRIKPRTLRSLMEPCIISIIFSTLCFFLPFLYKCRVMRQEWDIKSLHTVSWMCDEGQYNPMATISYVTSEELVANLFSHHTPGLMSYEPIAIYLVVYFAFACYTAGSAVAAGLVIPMLVIGSLIGRLVGLTVHDILTDFGWTGSWIEWADPGMFAFIGAGAVFAGMSRLTISLTVIMLELTNSLTHLLPLMVSVMIAKWVADFFTHSLYHALMEVKCIPFIDQLPLAKMDLFTVRLVMSSPVVCLSAQESVARIVEVLESTDHNGFPVVLNEGSTTLLGLMRRSQLELILALDETYLLSDANASRAPEDFYEQLINVKDAKFLKDRERVPPLSQEVMQATINLTPYMNLSPYTVADTFSLKEAWSMFRTLGLRHLLVVNGHDLVGIVTRKDLIGQHLEERIDAARNLSMVSSGVSMDSGSQNSLDGLMRKYDSAASMVSPVEASSKG